MTVGRVLLTAQVALAYVACGCDAPRPYAHPKPVSEARESPRKSQWTGNASCATAGCHGGLVPNPASRSSYTTWVQHDPHARAYEALVDELSWTIVKRLEPRAGKRAVQPPSKDPSCLGCHSYGENAGKPEPETRSRKDGVSCEACHGPAGRWLEPHSSPDWASKPDAEKAAAGFVLTKNFEARARLCVGCHVGEPDREVGHDLIAAGHPRLAFELTAYMADLPKHWDATRERQRRPDIEVQSWVIGQLVATQASAALLRARADTALRNPRNWPELSEYDCYTCHHELAEPSWRQRSNAHGSRPGIPTWGSWYWRNIPILARHAGDSDQNTGDSPLTRLRQLMNMRQPDPKEVRARTEEVECLIECWLGQVPEQLAPDSPALERLLDQLLAEWSGQETDGWDSAAQVYLGVRALLGSLDDPKDGSHARSEAALRELCRQLQFPEGYDSPRGLGPFRQGAFGEALKQIPRKH